MLSKHFWWVSERQAICWLSHTSKVRYQAPTKSKDIITQYMLRAFVSKDILDDKSLNGFKMSTDKSIGGESLWPRRFVKRVSFSSGSLNHPQLGTHCWARQTSGLSFSQSKIQIIFFCTLGSRVILCGACTTCIVMLGQESWAKMILLLKGDAQGSGVQLLLLAAEAMTKWVKHWMTPFSSVCVCFLF